MKNSHQLRQRGVTGLSALALLAAGAGAVQASTLSGNIANATAGTEAAVGSNWLTAPFGADASGDTLDSITLLLANPTPGVAELDLYTDGGLQPGSLVAALTSPANYSTALADTTFTTSGLTLDPSATYWAVLKADSGEFDWAYTTDDTGTGTGFQDTWGSSVDAGAAWFTFNASPTQMNVAATPAAANAVPEHGSLALLLLGGLPLALLAARRYTAKGQF